MGPIPAQDIIPDEEPTVESVPEVPRTDKRFKSESSRTQVLGDNPKEVREHARRSSEPGYYLSASGRNADRILHFLGDSYMVLGSIMSGTSSLDVLCHQSQNLMEYVSSAPRKVQCESTSPVVPRPLLRRRRERPEPERTLVLAVRQEAKAKSPVSPDGCLVPKRSLGVWRACLHCPSGLSVLGWHLTPLTGKVLS